MAEYATQDVYAEVDEINRLVAVKGQPVADAYRPYVDDTHVTTDVPAPPATDLGPVAAATHGVDQHGQPLTPDTDDEEKADQADDDKARKTAQDKARRGAQTKSE